MTIIRAKTSARFEYVVSEETSHDDTGPLVLPVADTMTAEMVSESDTATTLLGERKSLKDKMGNHVPLALQVIHDCVRAT